MQINDFVWPTNFHFYFGRQKCFYINSYLKFVGCLIIGLHFVIILFAFHLHSGIVGLD